MTLNVGQAAAAINVAIIIAQITFPLALVIILIGIVKEDSNAATWSVVGRLLNGSLWTSILGADSTPNKKVSRRVVFISAISTFGLLLLAVAGAITPLGLSSADVYVSSPKVAFQYAPDTSPMGQGTLYRAGYVTNRVCLAQITPVNCPGQAHGYRVDNYPNGSVTITSDTAYDYFSSTIPSNVTEIFTSASQTGNGTVAGFFDIQFRTWFTKSNPNFTTPSNVSINEGTPGLYFDPGNKTTVGAFQMLTSFVQEDNYRLVEGLILNPQTGGVGFRNHTIPATTGAGVEWEEEILFLEPDTVCVSTNLSLEFTLPSGFQSSQVFLTDRGGFKNLIRDYPIIDLEDPQSNPNIWARSWKGAVLNNYNLLLYFNESRNTTALGKQYNLGNQSGFSPNAIALHDFSVGPIVPGISLDTTFNTTLQPYPNVTNYIETGIVTQGFGGGDKANISNIGVTTGLFLGAGVRVDGINGSRLDPGSKWSIPYYSCSSAVYATIKTVTFVSNGSLHLQAVQVKSIVDKVYKDNASMPLWAVENSGLNISEISPIWGPVDSKYEKLDTLQTVRKPRFYIPAASDNLFGTLTGFQDSNAASRGPATAMKEAYDFKSSTDHLIDYSGKSNLPLFLRWQSLSGKPETASKIFNLIWMDIMANAFVGTASNAQNKELSGSSNEVKTLQKKITYDLRYAIPAIIFAVLYLAVLLSTCGMVLLRKSHMRILRILLNNTSVGRAVTNERFPGVVKRDAETKEWVREFGDIDIGIREDKNKATASDEKRLGDVKEATPLVQESTRDGKHH